MINKKDSLSISLPLAFGDVMIQKPLCAKKRTSLIAVFVYLAILLAPNGKLFFIEISEGLNLTPTRCLLIIMTFLIVLNLLSKKFNFISAIKGYGLFLPLILLLAVKMTSLLYSANYLGGMGAISGFIEAIFFSTLCYVCYVEEIIVPSKILIFIVAGFILSVSFAMIQISNFVFNSGFLLPLVDYVNASTNELHHFRVTGFYPGDPNVYATYIASVLLVIIAVSLLNQHLIAAVLAFLVGGMCLFSIQSRSSVIIFILVLIYLAINNAKKAIKYISILIVVFLLIVVSLPSRVTGELFEKYADKYISFANYFLLGDHAEEENLQGHKDIASLYFDNIDREPLAVITGVGEGDHLNVNDDTEKKGTGAHNAYVLVLSENGPVGAFIFLYITWLILKASFFVNKNSSTPLAKSFIYFNIAYLISFVLYGSQFLAPIFWAIIGITFAEKTRIQRKNAAFSGNSRLVRTEC